MVFKGANLNGKIWIFVEEGADFVLDSDKEQSLHGRLLSPRFACPIDITAVYAKCTRPGRYALWDTLRELANNLDGSPWIVGGEFNTILAPGDRVGSDTNRQAEMIDFAEAIEDCRLLDPGFDGAEFTWAKNGLFERLDRVLLSERWTRAFEATRVSNLPRVASDHGPVLVRCMLSAKSHTGRAFRFQNMWTRHEGFLELVREEWERLDSLQGLFGLQIKLKKIKMALKVWNKEVVGNIHANVKNMEDEIVTAQAQFEHDPSPSNRTAINKAIAQYILLLKMEEDFWRQKAAMRWLAEGDKNTKFYQSWVRQKKVRLRIHKIRVNGCEITDESAIQGSAVEFFRGLLAPQDLPLAAMDTRLFRPLPPSDQLEAMSAPPDADEVKKAVFDISGDSAPGPDGFTATFFQSY